MTKSNIITPLKIVFLGVLAITMPILLGSCSHKMSFMTSVVVPAARGTLSYKKDANSNYVIKIQLSNLAEATRLTPPKEAYVVWMVTDNDVIKNLGQINSSTKLLSKNLKASFETVSSSKPSRIFITAEEHGNVQFPNLQVILETASF